MCVIEETTAQVWSLSANDMMDDDVDLIDDDDLLDDDDLKKPDPASLRGKQELLDVKINIICERFKGWCGSYIT